MGGKWGSKTHKIKIILDSVDYTYLKSKGNVSKYIRELLSAQREQIKVGRPKKIGGARFLSDSQSGLSLPPTLETIDDIEKSRVPKNYDLMGELLG